MSIQLPVSPPQSPPPGDEIRVQAWRPAIAPVTPPAKPAQTLAMPTTPIVQKRTYAPVLSYVGSTRRIVAWAKRVGRQSTLSAVAAWTAGVAGLLVMYAFLVVWYAIVFGLFGVFMFPFRLMRRSQRKSQHLQEQQLATMQAMYAQQQAAPNQVDRR